MPIHDLDKFVNREKELALVKEKVARLAKGYPFAPHERVVHFIGPSGMGKSSLLEKLHNDLSKEPSCVSILIKLETIKDEQDGFARNFIQAIYVELSKIIGPDKSFSSSSGSISKLASVLVRTIKFAIQNKTLILLLDEINIPQRNELQSIEENVLKELLHENPKAVIITAGRSPATLNDFSLSPKLSNTFALSAFDEKATGDQLEKLKPGSAPIANKVLELGGGVPGNNTKLVVHLAGDPPNIPDELQAIRSLRADVISENKIEERFHSILDVICILQGFYPEDVVLLINGHPALGEQWDETKIKEMFFDLKQVQIGPGGLINWDREKKSWTVDKSTRDLFERELKMREPGLWRKLHCIAYQMYKQWGTDHNSQFYTDKALYHQQCLQSAGMGCDDLEG